MFCLGVARQQMVWDRPTLLTTSAFTERNKIIIIKCKQFLVIKYQGNCLCCLISIHPPTIKELDQTFVSCSPFIIYHSFKIVLCPHFYPYYVLFFLIHGQIWKLVKILIIYCTFYLRKWISILNLYVLTYGWQQHELNAVSSAVH